LPGVYCSGHSAPYILNQGGPGEIFAQRLEFDAARPGRGDGIRTERKAGGACRFRRWRGEAAIGSNEIHNANNVGTTRAEYFIVNIGRDDV
jgi:hypothetical protein